MLLLNAALLLKCTAVKCMLFLQLYAHNILVSLFIANICPKMTEPCIGVMLSLTWQLTGERHRWI